MNPDDERRHLIDVWHRSAADVLDLLRRLRPEEWELPTDLPGWTVRAVAAHLAHLESELAGHPQDPVEVPDAPHIRGLMGQYTETGPVARAGWPTERIVEELEASVAARHAALTADPPDLDAPAPGFAALAGWSWRTLLSNRPLDLWMHEQDIRRATGRPGGLDAPGAAHAVAVLVRSLPYVLGKRVGAPPGTTLVVEITGPQARTAAAVVGDDGRGAPLPEPPEAPGVRLVMDTETFVVLAGGRRPADAAAVEIEGDRELGRRVLEQLAVTP